MGLSWGKEGTQTEKITTILILLSDKDPKIKMALSQERQNPDRKNFQWCMLEQVTQKTKPAFKWDTKKFSYSKGAMYWWQPVVLRKVPSELLKKMAMVAVQTPEREPSWACHKQHLLAKSRQFVTGAKSNFLIPIKAKIQYVKSLK